VQLASRFHQLILKAGAQSDPIIYSGLSSTNGNMYRSRNARPVPGLSLSTNGYIPFLFAKKWFSWRFLYEEGILKDNQFVTNAHLHHKNLHVQNLFQMKAMNATLNTAGISPINLKGTGKNYCYMMINC